MPAFFLPVFPFTNDNRPPLFKSALILAIPLIKQIPYLFINKEIFELCQAFWISELLLPLLHLFFKIIYLLCKIIKRELPPCHFRVFTFHSYFRNLGCLHFLFHFWCWTNSQQLCRDLFLLYHHLLLNSLFNLFCFIIFFTLSFFLLLLLLLGSLAFLSLLIFFIFLVLISLFFYIFILLFLSFKSLGASLFLLFFCVLLPIFYNIFLSLS